MRRLRLDPARGDAVRCARAGRRCGAVAARRRRHVGTRPGHARVRRREPRRDAGAAPRPSHERDVLGRRARRDTLPARAARRMGTGASRMEAGAAGARDRAPPCERRAREGRGGRDALPRRARPCAVGRAPSAPKRSRSNRSPGGQAFLDRREWALRERTYGLPFVVETQSREEVERRSKATEKTLLELPEAADERRLRLHERAARRAAA
jgi:hypothetical protein